MHFLLVAFVFLMTQTVFAQTGDCLQRADRMIEDAHWYMDEVYDIEDLTLNFDREEVCRQNSLDNLVGFNVAFERALDAVFYDATDPESPLRLFIDWVFFNYGWEYGDYYDHEVEELARRHLMEYVNRSSSSLRLVPLGEPTAGGEASLYNWIFLLKLPDFSDHLFWTVEDRRGEEDTYIYGFN